VKAGIRLATNVARRRLNGASSASACGGARLQIRESPKLTLGAFFLPPPSRGCAAKPVVIYDMNSIEPSLIELAALNSAVVRLVLSAINFKRCLNE